MAHLFHWKVGLYGLHFVSCPQSLKLIHTVPTLPIPTDLGGLATRGVAEVSLDPREGVWEILCEWEKMRPQFSKLRRSKPITS